MMSRAKARPFQFMEDAMTIVENKLYDAMGEHAAMKSAHEGKAVIEEELDELWKEIKKKSPDNDKLIEEASHVAAMAVRFMVDVCLSNPTDSPEDA